MNITENLMESLRIRSQYIETRYLDHLEKFPEDLTLQVAKKLVKKRKRNSNESKLISIAKEYIRYCEMEFTNGQIKSR